MYLQARVLRLHLVFPRQQCRLPLLQRVQLRRGSGSTEAMRRGSAQALRLRQRRRMLRRSRAMLRASAACGAPPARHDRGEALLLTRGAAVRGERLQRPDEALEDRNMTREMATWGPQSSTADERSITLQRPQLLLGVARVLRFCAAQAAAAEGAPAERAAAEGARAEGGTRLVYCRVSSREGM